MIKDAIHSCINHPDNIFCLIASTINMKFATKFLEIDIPDNGKDILRNAQKSGVNNLKYIMTCHPILTGRFTRNSRREIPV